MLIAMSGNKKYRMGQKDGIVPKIKGLTHLYYNWGQEIIMFLMLISLVFLAATLMIAWTGVIDAGFLSLVSIPVTIIIGLATCLNVLNTRNILRAQAEPRVYISISPRVDDSFGYYDFIIENFGNGYAENVKLSIDKDYNIVRGKKLSDVGLFKNGVAFLAPKQRIKFFLNTVTGDNVDDYRGVRMITLNYDDSFGMHHSYDYYIDLSIYDEMCSGKVIKS